MIVAIGSAKKGRNFKRKKKTKTT